MTSFLTIDTVRGSSLNSSPWCDISVDPFPVTSTFAVGESLLSMTGLFLVALVGDSDDTELEFRDFFALLLSFLLNGSDSFFLSRSVGVDEWRVPDEDAASFVKSFLSFGVFLDSVFSFFPNHLLAIAPQS